MRNDIKEQIDEPQAVVARYSRRSVGDRYSMLRPEVWQGVQERQRVMLRLFAHDLGWQNLANLKLIEVGCGSGGNLLEFLRFGFSPQNIVGIELLSERAKLARRILPVDLVVHAGDANSVDIIPESQDVVFQSVVFSSLLKNDFQHVLADRMWTWVKPGGGVLWYDFIYNNPANLDVCGVPVKRIRELFPAGKMIVRRVTLAPPISRRVSRLHPSFYTILNFFPFLRTHILCWIQKNPINSSQIL